jgi:WD40 repeat protein
MVWSSDLRPEVRLWRPASDTSVASFTFPGLTMQVNQIAFDRHSEALAAICWDHAAEWSVAGATISSPLRRLPMTIACADPRHRLLAGVEGGDAIVLRDLDTLKPVWRLDAPVKGNHITRISPSGELVAFATDSGSVRVVRASDSVPVAELPGGSGIVTVLEFSIDSSRLLTAFSGTPARLWEIHGSRRIVRWDALGAGLLAGDMSPDGSIVALGGQDGRVYLCDARTGEVTRSLQGLNAAIWSMAFSPDGTRLAVGAQDRVTRVLCPATGDVLLELRAHTGTVMCLAWSPDGRYLAAGGYDQRVVIWDAFTQLGRIGAPPDPLTPLTPSRATDGR